MPFLVQLPGIGTITGMQILSAIGDVSRFLSAKHLVGYAGLGAKVQASGERQWSGGIMKQGRVDLRVAVIEAAWAAVRSSEVWRERFERLAQRIGDQKVIVALARKLLVVIWHVLAVFGSHDNITAPARRRQRTNLKVVEAVRTGQPLARSGQ